MYGPSTGHRVPGRNSGSPDASARACSCQSATLARSASARPCLRDCVGDLLRVAAGQGVPAGIPRGVQRRTADPPDTQDHRHVLAFGDRQDVEVVRLACTPGHRDVEWLPVRNDRRSMVMVKAGGSCGRCAGVLAVAQRAVTNVPLPLTVCTSPSARSTATALRTVWSATP